MGMTTCINFASNINKDVDEATHINAAINNKTFNDSLNAHEIDKEFNKYYLDMKEQVDIWKQKSLGFASIRSNIAAAICGMKDKRIVFTVEQLARLFALAN